MTTKTQDRPPDTVEITDVVLVDDPHQDSHDYMPVQTLGTLSDNFDASDFKIDRLNLVQSIGDLANEFPPGSFVFNKEVALTNPGSKGNEFGDELVFTLLSPNKFYQEDIPFDSDKQPLRATTTAEVTSKGGTLKWVEDEKPSWKTMLDLYILVKAPNEDFNDLFSLTGTDGCKYEVMNYMLNGRNLKKAGKEIMTRVFKLAKQGRPFYCHPWKIAARKETEGAYTTVVATTSPLSNHDDEMIQWIKDTV